MRTENFIKLWMTVLLLSASAVSYAADEDHIEVVPSDMKNGLYKINISGTRDSQIRYLSYNYSLFPVKKAEETGILNVYLTLIPEETAGGSTYREQSYIFLPPGHYDISLLVMNLTPPLSFRTAESLSLIVGKPAARVGLQNATGEISGTDSFILRNFAVDMGTASFNAWGKFQWNPDSWSWEFKDGGIQ